MTTIYAVSLMEEGRFERIRLQALQLLPEATRQKISQFVRSDDAQRSFWGELLSRFLLSEATGSKVPDQAFETGSKGKPFQEGYMGKYFNISHSGAWVVVAVSDTVVGVDVEKIKKVPEGVATRFFSRTENEMLLLAENETEKADIFFTLWTLKESFLKATGKGLTKSLGSFSVQSSGQGSYILSGDPEAEGYFLKNYSFHEGYKLSACSTADDFIGGVAEIDKSVLLKPAGIPYR